MSKNDRIEIEIIFGQTGYRVFFGERTAISVDALSRRERSRENANELGCAGARAILFDQDKRFGFAVDLDEAVDRFEQCIGGRQQPAFKYAEPLTVCVHRLRPSTG